MTRLFCNLHPIVLASASPRRERFLRDLGLDFTIQAAAIDETPMPSERPDTFARRMAEAKAEAVATCHPQALIISADTVVSLDDRILGKPRDDQDALAMLTSLQGRTHQVLTGLTLRCLAQELRQSTVTITSVQFATFPAEVLAAYVHTGEPMDKAGAYGIQGIGGFLVQKIEGSCSNVIGLPVNTLISLLLRHNVIRPAPNRHCSESTDPRYSPSRTPSATSTS